MKLQLMDGEPGSNGKLKVSSEPDMHMVDIVRWESFPVSSEYNVEVLREIDNHCQNLRNSQGGKITTHLWVSKALIHLEEQGILSGLKETAVDADHSLRLDLALSDSTPRSSSIDRGPVGLIRGNLSYGRTRWNGDEAVTNLERECFRTMNIRTPELQAVPSGVPVIMALALTEKCAKNGNGKV